MYKNWELWNTHSISPKTLINHVFLLKHLPQHRESLLEAVEAVLLKYVFGILKENSSTIKCLPITHQSFETWIALQMKHEKLNVRLRKTKAGQSACLYVRNQNCTILFTKLDPNYLRVITFRASLPNENVTGSCGSFVVTYPETVDIVPISPLLLSDCFSDQVDHLTDNCYSIAMPDTRKGGVDYNETREAPYPYLISDFLITLLCPLQPEKITKEMTKMKSINMQKKLRDQINWSHCDIPFRRSGLWTSIKVVLRLSLQEEMENVSDAELIYKVIILQIHVELAKDYLQNGGECWDIISQIGVKLARRVKKLSCLPKTLNAEIETQRGNITSLVIKAIEQMHTKKPFYWKTADRNQSLLDERSIEINKNSKYSWHAECIHVMEDLTNYLSTERVKTSIQTEACNKLYFVDRVSTEYNISSLVSEYSNGFSSYPDDDIYMNQINIWLFRVESLVRKECCLKWSYRSCYDILRAYTKTAFPIYSQADPLYFSRMTLVVLKLVAVLDEIAVTKYPLLKMYHCGIQPEMFQYLLVSEKDDMYLIANLQKYFTKRLEQSFLGNWLEERSSINEMDFQVQFARQSEEMKLKREEIKTATEANIYRKELEIEKVRKQALKISDRLQHLRCNKKGDVHYYFQCPRCPVRGEWESKCNSVSYYQKPLPTTKLLEDIVVFEYLIPCEIANLRDAVTILFETILNQPIFSVPKKDIKTNWNEFLELHGYEPLSNSENRVVRLGSDTYDTLKTHYASRNPDVMYSSDKFILENALNCRYYSVHNFNIKYPDNPFSFNVTDTTTSDALAYQSLQMALGQKRANENEVICNQYQCPQDLTLKEFITFGSLRCGHNIQLRNLYAAISSQILSLDKEPVLQLIMQTVWEYGPGKTEIHVEFEKDPQFCSAFLELLEKYGNENASNWGNPVFMLSLSVVVVRILELNEDKTVKAKAVEILKSYRILVDNWYSKLQALIQNIPKGSKQVDRKVLIELQLKAAICSAFTFSVSSAENIALVLKEAIDYTFWLKTLSRLRNLLGRENVLGNCNISLFMRSLLRHARVTIALNLESYISKHLDLKVNLPNFNTALHDFVCLEWIPACQFSKGPDFEFTITAHCNLPYLSRINYKRHVCQAIYTTEIGIHNVAVDIREGAFYVDGYPPSTLPDTITRNELFMSFFTNSDFRVQRDSNTFTTIDMYEDHHYEFTENAENLVIRQKLSTGNYAELLPKYLFKSHLPSDLITNYTQWYNSKTEQIYFQKTHESNYDYIMMPMGNFNWKMEKYFNIAASERAFLVSIKSEGYSNIANILKRIDDKEFIQIFCVFKKENVNNFQVVAHLKRMNLHFTLNKTSNLIYCNNYPGYYVPTSGKNCDGQNLGTLYGLNCGLVLQKETVEEHCGVKKIFLVQHGVVSISSPNISTKHQIVTVLTPNEVLRNPPYFVFEVDETLKRLKAGNDKSAWLYLALLHGATSCSLPDPFIQLTGTEMAMWILQSGFVWSCSPYAEECLNTLEQIASLSPKHIYYPSHLKVMQNTKWPEGLETNSYAAYDGYIILTEKLLQDSNRLKDLFPTSAATTDQVKELDFALELSIRSYFRYINMYNTVAHLNSDLFQYVNTVSGAIQLPAFDNNKMEASDKSKIRFAESRHQIHPSFSRVPINTYLCQKDVVPTKSELIFTESCLEDWFEMGLTDTWLQLYGLALQSWNDEIYHKMTLICGAILYSKEDTMDQLMNLHNISVVRRRLQKELPNPPRPFICGEFYPKNSEFDNDLIRNILQRYAAKSPSFEECLTEQQLRKREIEYETALNRQVASATQQLRAFWPVAEMNMETLLWALKGYSFLNAKEHTLNKINEEGFTYWFSNRSFILFVAEIDNLLKKELKFSSSETTFDSYIQRMHYLVVRMEADTVDKWNKTSIFSIEQTPDEKFTEDDNLPLTREVQLNFENMSWSEQRETCIQFIDKNLSQLRIIFLGEDPILCALNTAGIHWRIVPIVLLRNYMKSSTRKLSRFVVTLALLWANLKRLNRIILFQSQTQKYTVELERELKAGNEIKWSPLENPEWLLLELDLNISIRPIQVDVARRMIQMPGNSSGVMQLNMGEGKTSVIVPMVVSALTSEENRKADNTLCRVTVMSSIFATNHNILSFALGGFLNKRVYTVPCRRDFEIQNCLQEIADTYAECTRLGGVVITLPEHRLSFRLQMYNNFLRNEYQTESTPIDYTGFKMYQIENWLRKNARDIADESDEIFSVKYQLVYTAGKQLPIDGGSMRWKVGQQILEYICSRSGQLAGKMSNKNVEFDPKNYENYPEQFSPFRIINDECKLLFNEFIAKAVVNGEINMLGGNLSDKEKALIVEFLINQEITKERHAEFINMSGFTKEKKLSLLVTSGYLRGGILFTALKKRWRVEYGVKKTSSGERLIAVPFRAKDVAAERTEFGHPDMAIVLTLLSYYYSGLSDDQIKQCFHFLKTRVTAPKGIYKAWLRKIPPENIPNTVKSYEGINLQDYEQRTFLFELLRKNKDVIDFWLDNVVFPKECKQFPGKLVTNAWDLCYERYVHPTTGFSGTDDTSVLLPAPISQQNLAALEKTNADVEKVLLGPLNSYKRSLYMGATCEHIIKFVVKDDLRVLIDAGALMLQVGNEGIARLWLDYDMSLKGVVYFNERGEMTVKVRQNIGQDQLLTLSPLKDQLDDCAVYLDDQHTRGTDLKLPNNFKACVTVGTGLRRDKLIQACMRMRKLGKNQSVHFYLSHDVDSKIKAQKIRQGHLSEKITISDIIYWVKQNSKEFVKDGLVYWAGNARSYAKNLVADDLFEESDKSISDQIILANRIQDSDAQTLEQMYGTFHQRVSLKFIILTWFLKIRHKLGCNNSLPISAMRLLTKIENITLKHIQMQSVDDTLYSFTNLLDEEQEKELEPEQESQLEQYRPHCETPNEPSLHSNVIKLLRDGIFQSTFLQPGISRLSEIFRETTISSLMQYDCWGDQWFVTDDFKIVLATGSFTDSFLRPIRYFVSFAAKDSKDTPNRLLVLSQFEVDETIEYFRQHKSSGNVSTLHMFTARWMEGQEIFENNPNLQLLHSLWNGTHAKLTEDVMAPVLIAAGNLFFNSMKEQRAFAKFLGFRYKPWTDEEKEAHKQGVITNTGFVLPQCTELRSGCLFEYDPFEMVQNIMKLRNEVLRESDHAMIITTMCAFCTQRE